MRKLQREEIVPLGFLKENGLWGNGKNAGADEVKHLDGSMCCVVPSFSLENTKFDPTYLQRKEELDELVAKVVDRRRGRYQYRSNAPELAAAHINKRRRFTNPVHPPPPTCSTDDVEAAICFLHEQSEASVAKEALP